LILSQRKCEYRIKKAQLLFITCAQRLQIAGISCVQLMDAWLLPASDPAGLKRLCLHGHTQSPRPFLKAQILPARFAKVFPWLVQLFRCTSVKYATRCDMPACCASCNRFQKQPFELATLSQ